MPSEYVVRWSGGRIGSGASVFHFAATASPTVAQAAATAIDAFFFAIRAQIPAGITLRGDAEVRVLNADGTLENVLTVTPGAAILGTGTGAWANGIGGMVRWNTASVVNGRRLIGRTFIVPLRSGAFTSGELGGTALAEIQAAATALVGAMSGASAALQVWSRTNATVSEVISAQVPTRPSGLRTRNDRE